MEKKLIDLYKEWMELGTMGEPIPDGGGLCNLIPKEYRGELGLFSPDPPTDNPYWASDLQIGHDKEPYHFSKTRQTIVLFICAMHNEL